MFVDEAGESDIALVFDYFYNRDLNERWSVTDYVKLKR
jgi:hypothetical protein